MDMSATTFDSVIGTSYSDRNARLGSARDARAAGAALASNATAIMIPAIAA
jgi:O6-methylguanine-DNA--protein-cysteine methyltransferase